MHASAGKVVCVEARRGGVQGKPRYGLVGDLSLIKVSRQPGHCWISAIYNVRNDWVLQNPTVTLMRSMQYLPVESLVDHQDAKPSLGHLPFLKI